MAVQRSDLVRKVSRSTGLPPNEVDRVVVATLDHIAEELVGGRDVTFRRFGTFSLRFLTGFRRPNPRTGSKMEVPDRATATFRPSVTLKRRLNSA